MDPTRAKRPPAVIAAIAGMGRRNCILVEVVVIMDGALEGGGP
jgi:hypothetical protein